MTKKHTFTTLSSSDTVDLGRILGPQLKGQVIFLRGDLGAGKTTFVSGFAAGLGLKDRVVSPTFTYQRIYGEGTEKIYHFDLYRITNKADSLLEEEIYELHMQQHNTLIIEWPENLSLNLSRAPHLLNFEIGEGDTRTITHTEPL